MRGEQHIFYTLISAGILLSPALSITAIQWLAVFLVAVFIGSLAPDADSVDSAIMHGIPGGKGAVRVVRRHTVLILPLFGYFIRYLVYIPLSALLWITTLGKVRPKHRGILHSLFGIFFMSAIVTIFLFVIFLLLFSENFSYYAIIFGLGMFFGAFMHLLEDSCSKSGVYWLYPLSGKKASGKLLTGSRRNLLIAAVLGIGFAAVYVNDFTSAFPSGIPFAAPMIVLLFSWIIILRISGTGWS